MTNPNFTSEESKAFAALSASFEPDYAPPTPARTAETVAEVGDCILVSYYDEGQRYAAIGATEADARKLLAEQPQLCRVP